MPRTKRRRQNSITSNNEKKKLQGIFNLSKTNFEGLANETLCEIFEYLSFNHIYLSFSNLNIRFESFLRKWTLPIQINPLILSQSAFDYYHKNIVINNKYQIKTLHLSYSFVINQMFKAYSFSRLSNYSQLEKLILNNIEKRHIINILKSLQTLPNLVSLTIICHERMANPVKYFRELSPLPKLKYCKVKFEAYHVYTLFRLWDCSSSSIEELIIDNKIWIANLQSLLHNKCQLRYLTIEKLCGYTFPMIITSSNSLKNLTKLTINKLMISFQFFQSFIKTYCRYLQILNVSQDGDLEYLNANQWQKIISSHMTDLKIFSVHFHFIIEDISTLKDIIEEYHTSFWFERQWFFQHNINTVSDKLIVNFYSINPYKKKSFILNGKNDQTVMKIIPLNSVDHIDIQDTSAINNCRNSFPSTTKITFNCEYPNETENSLFINLHSILQLKQLTTLNIKTQLQPLTFIIKLLNLLPNVNELIFNYPWNFNDIIIPKEDENIKIISSTTQIRKLIINNELKFEQIEFLIGLCPQLEYLMFEKVSDIRSILLFLLSKTNHNTHHLYSLRIHDVTKTDFNRIMTLIKYNKLLNNFIIDFVSELQTCHIWW